MTTRRRDSRPTWAIWWLLPILLGAWPLIAFAHYPPNNQAMQFTGPGWIAEGIWLAILASLGIYLAAAHHRGPAGHRTPRTPAVNPADSLRGQPRPPRQ